MTSQQILQSDLLDILFEKRNKLYGAYLLRRNYSMELLKAIGITSISVLLLIFLVLSATAVTATKPFNDTVILTTVELPGEKKPEPIQKPQPHVAQPPVRTEVLLDRIQIVDHTLTPIASQKNFEDAVVGSVKGSGIADPGIPSPPQEPVSPGSGNENTPPKTDKELTTRAPQFPGGIAAWQKFLSVNLHSPQDLEPGEKKTVVIKFHVDVDGMVTGFQVVQSGGDAFDNEVIRVLKKMPRWMPALQQGQAVAVPFSQPVTFVGMEE